MIGGVGCYDTTCNGLFKAFVEDTVNHLDAFGGKRLVIFISGLEFIVKLLNL